MKGRAEKGEERRERREGSEKKEEGEQRDDDTESLRQGRGVKGDTTDRRGAGWHRDRQRV